MSGDSAKAMCLVTATDNLYNQYAGDLMNCTVF